MVLAKNVQNMKEPEQMEKNAAQTNVKNEKRIWKMDFVNFVLHIMNLIRRITHIAGLNNVNQTKKLHPMQNA